MNPLTRFLWYRRARGGYWAQVTTMFGWPFKTRWVRCKELTPSPDRKWEFYPWGTTWLGNGYIDEWHMIEPCYAVPFTSHLASLIGTSDPEKITKLVRTAQAVSLTIDSKELSEALQPFSPDPNFATIQSTFQRRP